VLRKLTTLASAAAVCAAIAGCGASDVLTAATRDARTTRTEGRTRASGPIAVVALARDTHPRQSADAGELRALGRQLSGRANSVGPTAVQHAAATPGSKEPQEPTGNGAPQLNPCTLVTAAQAESITGASAVGIVEAPSGPTCIYTPRGPAAGRSEITLTVEPVKFSVAISHLAARTASTIEGMQADCGTLGRPTMFVRLPKGAVLLITAPCAQARRFAADALRAFARS